MDVAIVATITCWACKGKTVAGHPLCGGCLKKRACNHGKLGGCKSCADHTRVTREKKA